MNLLDLEVAIVELESETVAAVALDPALLEAIAGGAATVNTL